MRIENFNEVRDLMKDRDYYGTLLRIAGSTSPKIVLGGHRDLSDHSLRPDLIAKLIPDVKLIIEQQIGVIDDKLGALGVYAK